jgi:DNA-directed RNA polymerase subunit RPC12/RpoP
MTDDVERCVRCGREIPTSDPDFAEWEALDDRGDQVTCGHCLTVDEVQAIADGDMRSAIDMRLDHES